MFSVSSRQLPFWLPVLLVALMGWFGCYTVWQQQTAALQAVAQARFEQEARVFADTLERRMDEHTDLLLGVRGLLLANPQLERSAFERAVGQSDRLHRHPAVKNVHFTRAVPAAERQDFEARSSAQAHIDGSFPHNFAIHPDTLQDEYFVLDFLWPLEGNESVQGLELHSQPTNLAALLRARDSRALVASAPFDLYQETTQRTGVVLRVPVFVPDAQAPEGERFLGAVGLVLRIHDMFAHLRREGRLLGLGLRLTDVGPVGSLSAEPNWPLFATQEVSAPTQFQRQFMLTVGQRQWQLQIFPTVAFSSPAEQRMPLILTAGALAMTLLLMMLVALLTQRRAQALRQVDAAGLALRHSEGRFEAVFNQATVGMAQTDTRSGRILRANQKFCDIVGYNAEQLHDMRYQDFTLEEDLATQQELNLRMQQGVLPGYQLEKRYVRSDGRVIWVDLMISPLLLDGDNTLEYVAVTQDITERKAMEQELREGQQYLRDILNHMPLGVNQVVGERIVFRNARHVQMCGYDEHDAPDIETWWRLTLPDEQAREQARSAWADACRASRNDPQGTIAPVECLITAKNGAQRSVELSGMMFEAGHIVVMVDHSQRKEAEAAAHYLTHNDPLTGLPNRRWLHERLQQALQHSERQKICGALLLLDLDHFKAINETQGHQVGDRLLSEVALRLRLALGDAAVLARHGGDEFAVLLPDLGDEVNRAAGQAQRTGQELLQAMRQALSIGDAAFYHCTLSIGISLFQGQEVSAQELLQRCEIAMYEAKNAGRDTLRFYDPQMQASVTERVQMLADMRSGLEDGQFELYYQPKVASGRIIGAEALLRWKHPERGFVSPALFIPLAEEGGMILPIGQWVLRSACTTLAHWQSDPLLASLKVAVNVSPRQFHEDNFVTQVLAALARSSAQPNKLLLELTEGMLLTDVDSTIEKMQQLKNYGVGFSLDDFGTGYSSLSYLKRLPLNELKIDQSFVRDVLEDPNDAAIVRTIIALGSSMGLQVIAEGVETPEQRAFLQQHGCHAWQGYLLSRPVPVAEFVALVRQQEAVVAPLSLPVDLSQDWFLPNL